MSAVLHLDLIRLNPETTHAQREALLKAAGNLRELDGVEAVGVIEVEPGSDFDVAVWFLLQDFAALEPFGTDPRYSRFLQGTVAPLLKGFAGADVTLSDGYGFIEGKAACLALTGPEETYDFEVREALEAWADAMEAQAAAIGVAVGERQMYRGAALAFGGNSGEAPLIDGGPFQATLLRGASRTLA